MASTVSAVWERTIQTSQYSTPSTDSGGIVYIPGTTDNPSGSLLISDSEVEKSPWFMGKNLFEVSLEEGALLGTLTTIPFVSEPTRVSSSEPTDVAYDPLTKRLFITDDNYRRVFILNSGDDGDYNTEDDTVTYFNTSLFGSADPEGIVFDSLRGHLFVVDGEGEEVYDISPGENDVFDGVTTPGDDQVSQFDVTGLAIKDPEGVAFNPDNNHLYIMTSRCTYIAETTIDGTLVRYINISALKTTQGARMCAGLTYAPSSTVPGQMNLYIVDRGLDDLNVSDGKLYEISFPSVTPANHAPEANARTISIRPTLILDDISAKMDWLLLDLHIVLIEELY